MMTTYRILYVDDDPMMCEITSLSLNRDPAFEVRTCGSGPEALAMLDGWRPDLVLLDVVMPGMDGPAVFAGLREHAPDNPIAVVFVTARTRPEEAERLLALGAAGIIAKPFVPATLAAAIRAHLPARGLADG
jgi:CheY-like chemotaxis protein